MAAPLLTTKLYIPPVRPELVPRPRLIEHLNAGLDRKLTLVSAPAGYGKTTLISAWLQVAGVPLAVDAGWIDVSYETASRRYNGVVEVVNVLGDPVVSGYATEGHDFTYGPVWFTDYGSEINVSTYLGDDNFFVSGFWPGWDTGGANGMPIIVHGPYDSAEITLMGIKPAFRAHPAGTFRILANAIYNGLE